MSIRIVIPASNGSADKAYKSLAVGQRLQQIFQRLHSKLCACISGALDKPNDLCSISSFKITGSIDHRYCHRNACTSTGAIQDTMSCVTRTNSRLPGHPSEGSSQGIAWHRAPGDLPRCKCMKLPHISVLSASCFHLADSASEGRSFCVSHRDALLMTPLLALILVAPPSSLFFLSNCTPTAFPPALVATPK